LLLGKKKEKNGEFDEKDSPPAKKPFVFLHVNVLREYLEAELRIDTPFPFDFERVIDDWVFLCFFVGNDFLPHLPSLEIREGAIDRLVEIYKQNLCHLGGYITDHGEINLGRAEILMADLAKVEDEIFRQRREREEKRKQREEANKRRRLGLEINSASSSLRQEKLLDQSSPSNVFSMEHIAINSSSNVESNYKAIAVKKAAAKASVDVNKDILAQRRANREANRRAAENLRANLTPSTGTSTSPITASPSDTSLPVTSSQTDSTGTSPSVNVIKETITSSLTAAPSLSISPSPLAQDSTVTIQPVERIYTIQSDANEGSNNISEDSTVSVNAIVKVESNKAAKIETDEIKEIQSNSNETSITSAKISTSLRASPLKRKIDELIELDAQSSDDATDSATEDIAPIVHHIKSKSTDGEELPDNVRLWEPGWKGRYYQNKFDVSEHDTEFRKTFVIQIYSFIHFVSLFSILANITLNLF